MAVASQWFTEAYLGKETEAKEVIFGSANGGMLGVMRMTSTTWHPERDGRDSTASVIPPDLGVKRKV